ncbi:uncharacterized protein LOC122887644 isoform X3 [Siniperca chuatsi]|uniref:uncharacterized protein LOC122887644 isoform X3 n=1 Tax=Siniperca chuatsi TaxID=119488 RepID=UPI001CE05EC0|nr:uncharacterized protein LOC122887644 isoform X3 [Siniperca chuatsi]
MPVKKNTHRQGTGGGSPKADLTPAEDMALELNKGRPVLEGIPGGKETSIGSSQDATRFIQVSGSTVFLLEPPAQAPGDADPGESPSAAATAHDGDDDEERPSLWIPEGMRTQMLYSGKTSLATYSKKMTQLKIKISNQYNQVIVIRHQPLLPTPPAPGVATSLYEGPKLCVPFCSDNGMPILARCGG